MVSLYPGQRRGVDANSSPVCARPLSTPRCHPLHPTPPHAAALLTHPHSLLQAARLTLVQILINAKGYNMNPLQSLYYVSPACLLGLAVPWGERMGAAARGGQAGWPERREAVQCCSGVAKYVYAMLAGG